MHVIDPNAVSHPYQLPNKKAPPFQEGLILLVEAAGIEPARIPILAGFAVKS
jgi:hypothetical protein